MTKPLSLPYAVLTGDIIGSTGFAAEKVEQALAVIAGCASDHAVEQADIAPKFTRFRGDGWQFVLSYVPLALPLALRLQAHLAGRPDLPKTRVSIGIGAVTSFGDHDLARASGPAFVASGRGLDWLETRGGTIAIHGPNLTYHHQIIAELFELRMRQWTPPQAEAAALLMEGRLRTGREIARHLRISEQAVSYRLAGADARKMLELLENYRTEFSEGFANG
ncbi:MAG: hypothetical protein E6Q73_11175 [Pseudorhodobacter sp.]|nr:MAG: hypothetical protein E6Q73_11175 [Pseudorhodobacter sp.]